MRLAEPSRDGSPRTVRPTKDAGSFEKNLWSMSLLPAARRAGKRHTMKTFVLLSSILAAGVITPAFASESIVSALPTEGVTLEELLAQSRVSVGASRAGVLNQMHEPNLVLSPDVWLYTGFRATNVVGGERYDTLVVIFKHDRIDAIKLTKEDWVRMATARSGSAAQPVAKR
jgi:hypothetical protein